MGSAETFHVVDAVSMQEIYQVPLRTKGSAAVSIAYATEEKPPAGLHLYGALRACGRAGADVDHQRCRRTDGAKIRGSFRHRPFPDLPPQSVAIAKDGALLWYNDGGYLYCYEKKSAATADCPFPDIKGHWAQEAVTALADRNILTGTDKNLFLPDTLITRAQLVQILYAAQGKPEVNTTSPFTDVSPRCMVCCRSSLGRGEGNRIRLRKC